MNKINDKSIYSPETHISTSNKLCLH